ncbi:PIG-L family deacetylase [Actinomadura rupiterrae]|uniref:PIG-L family deacetylase n=1 Tax=Actinomadura rupiterrae TaxID=559627 RepID=UPI0020A2461A|nr:PIG-L family deacetylase [Actinomadura rupiterrae]MCP2340947.1 LmbE family N-acetylglucosaminyl deacetylase [Actinomadura rupiterrae]
MEQRLTLMAVHAHPDDEVLGTGGVLAQAVAEGHRAVLVTCTNGEMGDDAGGLKPEDEGHDAEGVARVRLAELEESVSILGIEHVELLGYRDSGMVGWSTNDDPRAFSNIPVEDAAARLAELMEQYRPDVVVTYDENGNYGHPDHIQAHRIAVAASESTGIPRKFYETAVPRSGIEMMFKAAKDAGLDLDDTELPDDFGTPDELITTRVDVSAHVERKRKALEAHASQGENIFLLRLPDEMQAAVFGSESFVRRSSSVDADLPETDLFAGLRD